MRALDDAERLLVSGSFERAKSEAAAARQGAGSTSERVAAECVWIQAEYKLGGLTRHDLDAARMAAGFGEEFHRASALLWSRLRLANPADPAEAEAAAEKALQRIFERTLVDRRGGRRDEEGDDDAEILPGAAWLYAVHLTSQRRRRPRDARTWLTARVNEGTLTADAWRRLDAEIDDAIKVLDDELHQAMHAEGDVAQHVGALKGSAAQRVTKKAVAVFIEEELQLAPWTLTANLHAHRHGRHVRRRPRHRRHNVQPRCGGTGARPCRAHCWLPDQPDGNDERPAAGLFERYAGR